MKKIILILSLCVFFIYGCNNEKKASISISTPEKDAKEMSIYHKQVLKGEISQEEFLNILNTKVDMYIDNGRDRDEIALFLKLSNEIMRNTSVEYLENKMK